MTDASFAVATLPVFVPLIPAEPAQILGRLGVVQPQPSEIGPLPSERLLGALELAVAGHDWSTAPHLAGDLPAPPTGTFAFVTAVGGPESTATTALRLVEQLRPGLTGRAAGIVRSLARHPEVAPLLAVPGDADAEAAIAARHGAAHLALAVAVAGAVVEQAAAPIVAERTAAVVGLAISTAAQVLRETPMPPAYADAVLAKQRAEYVLPRGGFGTVAVSGHRFGLLEHGFPAEADFSGNGLVAVVEGGVVVRTGIAEGAVSVEHSVLDEPPAEVDDGWEEIVEVSWRAAEGAASLVGPDGGGPARSPGAAFAKPGSTAHLHRLGIGNQGQRLTPPWPGDYRVRVHARERDAADGQFERYRIVVWAAPARPEIVHRRSDVLGHRLRGEPEPVREQRPEHAYRWVRHSRLEQAATVTVATGIHLDEALRAFGAEPHRSLRLEKIRRNVSLMPSHEPWITARDLGGIVILVEENGFRGSDEDVLRALSAHGRAASMFWNVNALTRLSFAERGSVLAAFEPMGPVDVPPPVAAALDGIDFADFHDHTGKGLAAVERFTGRGITTADLAHIDEAGVGWFLA